MKEFKIEANASWIDWCKKNLDDRDYAIGKNAVTIYYRHEFQKEDILLALPKCS